ATAPSSAVSASDGSGSTTKPGVSSSWLPVAGHFEHRGGRPLGTRREDAPDIRGASMADAISVSAPISGTDRSMSMEAGKLAQLADGAVLARIGDTVILTTA